MDPALLTAQILLLGLGIFGVAQYRPDLVPDHAARVVLGVAATLVVGRMRANKLLALGPFLFVIAGLGLLVALVIGDGPGGVRRWISLGGLEFQPSELMKLALVIYLASFFHRHGRAGPLAGPVAIIGLTVALVLAEPDLGTAVHIAILALAMLFAAGVGWFRLISIGVAGLALSAALAGPYVQRFGYIQGRLTGFLDYISARADTTGSAYQVSQSLAAVRAGGFIGSPPGTALPHLPAAPTDMILASVAAGAGLLGALAVVACFVAICWRGLQIADAAIRPDARGQAVSAGPLALMAFGATFALALQATLNIGVTVGLLPVTGMPLPLVSYGGTSLLAVSASLGILHAVNRYVREAHAPARPAALDRESGVVRMSGLGSAR